MGLDHEDFPQRTEDTLAASELSCEGLALRGRRRRLGDPPREGGGTSTLPFWTVMTEDALEGKDTPFPG